MSFQIDVMRRSDHRPVGEPVASFSAAEELAEDAAERGESVYLIVSTSGQS